MTYRPEIDGLRAVAVLAVLLYHCGGLVPGGFAGVDVFFVISGFVITSVISAELREDRFTIAGFYERRVRRIAPALLATIAVTAVAAFFILLPPDLASFGKSAVAATLMVSNVLFWLQAGYFDAAAQSKPLLHTWSLGIEEQFYLVFPLILAALWKRAPRFILPALLAIFAASLAAGQWASIARPTAGFYLVPFRFWELLLGALIALRPVPALQNSASAGAGLAMIAASYALFHDGTPFPGFPALLPTLGAALVINGARGGDLAARALGAPPLVFVGKISYSLYLVHWPLIVLLEYRQGAALGLWQAAGVVVASIALAALSWRFVEQPFRRPAEFGRYRQVFGTVAIASGAVCALGVLFFATKGLPSRLAPNVLAAYAASADKWKESAECFVDTKGHNGPSPDEVRAGKLCRIGRIRDGERPDFVVWGDSHAASTAPAIRVAAERNHARGLVVGAGACPPLKNFDVLGFRKSTTDRCEATNAALLDFIAEKRPPIVFMVARWPKYALGNEYGEEGYFFDPSSVAPPVKGEDGRLAAALDETLSELRKLGVKPVIFMAVPEPGYNVPYAYAKALMHGKDPTIVLPRATVDGRQARAREILAAAAEKYGATLIDPTPRLCAKDGCRLDGNGTPLYADSDHLTQSAAISLSDLFDGVFRDLRRTPAAER